ncbi:MAG: hypothetical protein EOO75_05620, partial [Myxococcales bacterium]
MPWSVASGVTIASTTGKYCTMGQLMSLILAARWRPAAEVATSPSRTLSSKNRPRRQCRSGMVVVPNCTTSEAADTAALATHSQVRNFAKRHRSRRVGASTGASTGAVVAP